jgi:hypothetical protein
LTEWPSVPVLFESVSLLVKSPLLLEVVVLLPLATFFDEISDRRYLRSTDHRVADYDIRAL